MASIFILGATGYIGASFVTRLRQEIPNARLTALVRNPAHVGALKDLGVFVVLGDVEDLERVVDLASNADIVFNAALSDHIPLVQAISAAQRSRADHERKSALIHISRSALSVHQEEPRGLGLQTLPINDLDTDQWMPIESNDLSRLVDNELVGAADDPLMSTYIVAPTVVYGEANTPSCFPHRSRQLRGLIQCALERRHMILPTDGMNVTNGVHLRDLIDLLLRITRLIVSCPRDRPNGDTLFFFASGPDFYLGQLAINAANILYQRGMLNSSEVSTCRLKDYPQLRNYSTNIRVQSLRGTALGWSPNQDASLLDELDSEIDGILKDLENHPSGAQ